MKIKPFELERYFAQYEFNVKYLLSNSDCSGIAQSELLSWADDECRALWDNLVLAYTESAGLPLLRSEIASMYEGISADQILVAVPEEAVFIAMNCILEPGDHVICTYPGYQSLYEIAQSIGCEVTRWEPNEDDGWRFDPEFVQKSLRPNTKLIVANFPHNPTGYLPTQSEYERLIDIARQNNTYLFSDEMYRFLERTPSDRLSSAVEKYDNTISLFGMSKTFGLPGLRLGWVITKNKDILNAMASFKDYTTICPAAPSEILALIGLRARDRIVERHVSRIARNIATFNDFLAKHSDWFSWVAPRAGTIAFVKTLFSEPADAFAQRVVTDAGVMILPSTACGWDNKHFRIGLGREDFPESLGAFDDYLAQYPPN